MSELFPLVLRTARTLLVFHSVHMRPYTQSDVESLIGVYTAAIHSLAAPYYTPEQLDAWAPPNQDAGKWRERLASVQTLVAEHDGIIAGFASYKLDGHLFLLFTHPNFARQGVATRLCRRVESALRATGVTRIFTEASLAGQPFFEHCGFELGLEELVECRGVRLRRFHMHKQISL